MGRYARERQKLTGHGNKREVLNTTPKFLDRLEISFIERRAPGAVL